MQAWCFCKEPSVAIHGRTETHPEAAATEREWGCFKRRRGQRQAQLGSVISVPTDLFGR